MKSHRFERLSGLVAEVVRKRELLASLATRLKGKQDECDARWQALQLLAGPTADLTKIDASAWGLLPAEVQCKVLDQLAALVAGLDDELGEEGWGWLMSRRLVGTPTIVALAAYCIAVMGGVLWVISTNWREAIQQPLVEAAVKAEQKRLREDIESLTGTGAAPRPTPDAELERKKRELDSLTNLPELVRKALDAQVPDEGLALRMVVYMGMLGGCLHLLSSLVRYVGDRKLRRSWLLYYLAVPVQGAGLALLVYLLLRVGVLAPSSNGDGGIAQANLVGIYAFAGLTGMFAKAATEKLGEVFLTLFRTAEPAGDSVKDKPKGKLD